MATRIAPEQFSKIMALPTELRRDLLEFLGFASVGREELGKIINDLENLNRIPELETGAGVT